MGVQVLEATNLIEDEHRRHRTRQKRVSGERDLNVSSPATARNTIE